MSLERLNELDPVVLADRLGDTFIDWRTSSPLHQWRRIVSMLEELNVSIVTTEEWTANGERVEWCEPHHAQMVSNRDRECWDAERLHPCRIVSRLLINPPTEEE